MKLLKIWFCLFVAVSLAAGQGFVIDSYRFASGSDPVWEDLVSWYDMDDPDDETDVVGSDDLTETGAVDEVSGKNGNARGNYSASDYLGSSALGTGGNWSMSFWANATLGDHVVTNGANGTGEWTLKVSSGGQARLKVSGTDRVLISGLGSGTHFFALGHDGTDWWMSIDGATASTWTGSAPTATTFRVGVRSDGSAPLSTGWVDALGVWDADIRDHLSDLYNSGNGKFYPN